MSTCRCWDTLGHAISHTTDPEQSASVDRAMPSLVVHSDEKRQAGHLHSHLHRTTKHLSVWVAAVSGGVLVSTVASDHDRFA
jgi:hypothetical protein